MSFSGSAILHRKVARDASGNLYGITEGGGNGYGTIFKVDKRGKETGLYSFTGGSDGCVPQAGVITDVAGNLYGVAAVGGLGTCDQGYGVVFELGKSGTLSVLHTFGFGDGAYPGSVLAFDEAGNLYGTTRGGGSSACGADGCGVVFELSPNSDGSWTEAVLYEFCSLSGCADGEEPVSGPLVRDSKGNLYGTTFFGGTSHNCNGGNCGVVFKLDPVGKETVIHDFAGGTDGGTPAAGLIMDKFGILYGTAQSGGDRGCNPPTACGTVFKVTP